MPAFSSVLRRAAVLLAPLSAVGAGCGGRTGDDFPADGLRESGGGSPNSSSRGGRAQGGAPSQGGSAMGNGGASPGTGGRLQTTGGRGGMSTSGGISNRGGAVGTGGTPPVAGRQGTGGDVGSTSCGNGVLEAGEECDPGSGGPRSCDYGVPACRACSSSCRWVAGVTSPCGDGKVDPAGGEECDDGNASTELCAYGQTSCAVCGPRCTKAAGIVSYCGDGRLDSTYESCDPGSLPTQVCAYGKTSCSVCGAACVVVSGKTSYCGDGLVDASNGELCDQGAESKDCATPCPFRCGAIAGPKLTEAIDQWPSAGMLIVATEDATLAGFVFNNQGKADTITLTRLSDGVVLGVLGIAAGLSPTLSVDVFWNLEAGQNYALTSSDESNGRWAQYQGTSPVSPGIRVDRVYSPETKETAGLWFTFTEIRSCLR